MVQTNSALIEGEVVGWIGEFVEPDERLTFDEPTSSSERSGAFVPVKRHFEESFVSPDTAVEITDGQSHVCDGRQVRHGNPLVKDMETDLPGHSGL